MRKQLRRWSHGFMQNVRLHWRGCCRSAICARSIGVALWESTIASIIYLCVVPMTARSVRNPLILLVYILDAPALMVPVLVQAARRGEFWRALLSIPAFFVVRVVNCVFVLEAIWSEMIVGRRLVVTRRDTESCRWFAGHRRRHVVLRAGGAVHAGPRAGARLPRHQQCRAVATDSSCSGCYFFSIIGSILHRRSRDVAALGGYTPGSFGPAHLLHGETGARAPHLLLAAPMTAAFPILPRRRPVASRVVPPSPAASPRAARAATSSNRRRRSARPSAAA